jgi:hypothetical protein
MAQPPPIKDTTPVFPELLRNLEEFCHRRKLRSREVLPLLEELVMQRVEFGRQKYGTVLGIFNGRDAIMDAWEEAVDLCFYLAQAWKEGNDVAEEFDLAMGLLFSLTHRARPSLEKQAVVGS